MASKAKPAAKKAPAKKVPAKKSSAKKAVSKAAISKVPVKKPAAKKPAAKNAPAKKAPAKKVPAKKIATKPVAKKPAAKPVAKKPIPKKPIPKKPDAKKPVPKKPVATKAPVKKAPAEPAVKAAAVKAAPVKAVPVKVAPEPVVEVPVIPEPPKVELKLPPLTKGKMAAPSRLAVRDDESPWTKAELDAVRKDLLDEQSRLRVEHQRAEAALADLIRDGGDGAGDDQADAGAKTFEREHEMSLANNTADALDQVDRALARIDDGSYGVCESCGAAIGKHRLQAFPRATLCRACKEKEERR